MPASRENLEGAEAHLNELAAMARRCGWCTVLHFWRTMATYKGTFECTNDGRIDQDCADHITMICCLRRDKWVFI